MGHCEEFGFLSAIVNNRQVLSREEVGSDVSLLLLQKKYICFV